MLKNCLILLVAPLALREPKSLQKEWRRPRNGAIRRKTPLAQAAGTSKTILLIRGRVNRALTLKGGLLTRTEVGALRLLLRLNNN